MFTDKALVKLFNTPGMRITTLRHFIADRRLTEPFAIINDLGMQFGEYTTYPDELGVVAMNNGF